MKKVQGFLGDRVMVDVEGGDPDEPFVLDLFVDDSGHVRALAKSDPKHPEHRKPE